MRISATVSGLAVGAVVGIIAAMFYLGQPRTAGASGHDRYQDYIMATGAVTFNPRVPMDGVWLLDYRSGKLLGTVIDKSQGKIVGWAEVDLVSEFEVTPRQDVHFMMVTGWVSQGQSALYVAETSTGKFGVYTMMAGVNGAGVVVKRHDLTSFRRTAPAPAAAPVNAAQPPVGAPAVVPVGAAPVGAPAAVPIVAPIGAPAAIPANAGN